MGKYELEKVNEYSKWDEFVEASPQGTVFSCLRYLKSVGRKFDAYFLFRGGEIKAGLSLILTEDGGGIELDDSVIYNGLMFKYDDMAKESSARLERFEITEFVIDELVKRYNRIEMALAPQFEDLRPFLWRNYHSTELGEKFQIDVRYTSYLNISEFAERKMDTEMKLFKNMERLRRRRVKEAIKAEAQIETGTDAMLLVNFYRQLMESQNIIPPEGKLIRMKKLVEELVENKQGVMFFVREKDGQISYAIFFCFDAKRAYALFAAGDPKVDNRYTGTFAYWEGCKYLSVNNIAREVDLEGVNSPERGWFKLSFGGDLRPYYQIYKGYKI